MDNKEIIHSMKIFNGKEYGVSEAARALGVGYRQVLRYIGSAKDGLRACKVAISPRRKVWRIRGKDIKDFLRRGEQ